MKQLNWYQIFGKSNIPDGRTVLPTDDIQIWLHCANIWDKTYTTLAEVLADTDTLLALITSNNAVDYMVRSTSWAESTAVPKMTSNTTPRGEVIFLAEHSTDYRGYKAFDENNSTFWNTGSPTLPTWIGYDFQTNKRIENVFVQFASYNTSATVKVQGSDDKSTWIDESEETVVSGTTATTISADGYYRYHRLYISAQTKTSTNSGCITTLQFSFSGVTSNATAMTYIGQNNYCANTLLADATWCNAICNSTYFESVLNVKVPTMTSNTTPEGECFASSVYQTYQPYLAFDGNQSTYAFISSQAGFVGYKFTDTVFIYKAVSNKQTLDGAVTSLEASTDGTNWVRLCDFTDTQTNTSETHTFMPSTKYDRYRFNIRNTNPNYGFARFFDGQLYGRKDV